MTVLHVTDCDGGGVPAVIDTLLDHLPGQVLFTNTVPENFRNTDRILAALEHPRSKSPTAFLRIMRDIVRVANGADFRLIHGHSSFGGVYGGMLARRRRLPFVYMPHASPAMMPNRSMFDRAISLMEAFSFFQARRVIACSTDEAVAIAGLCSKKKIEVIANGVDISDTPLPERPEWDVLFVGRIASQKRPDLFVEMAEMVRTARPDTRIGWIGSGSPPDTSAVEWLGSQSEETVRQYLRDARIFASFSDYEGLSLSALVAACSGCHLLLRDTPGNRTPVALGAVGSIFTTPADAARNVIAFLNDPLNQAVKSRICQSYNARQLFSTQTSTRTMQSVYDAILG